MSKKGTMNLYVRLTPNEFADLIQLAQRERRDYRDQAAILIREQLEKLGFPQSPTTPAVMHANEETTAP
jgi:hypothetical protein